MSSYTELKDGSRNVGLVVHIGTSRPISKNGRRKIRKVVTANIVPNTEPSPELLQELNKDEEEPTKKLTTKERQELLMQVLQEKGGLDMLEKWENLYANQARQLLMEFHNVFSLEKNEMGCTDTTEHVIKLTTRKPYGFMQSCSVFLPSQIHMTKFTPHLGYFFQFNQRCGKN